MRTILAHVEAETIEEFVSKFALEHGVERFDILRSEEELKKSSLSFF